MGTSCLLPTAGEFGDPYTSFTDIANDGNLDSKPAVMVEHCGLHTALLSVLVDLIHVSYGRFVI